MAIYGTRLDIGVNTKSVYNKTLAVALLLNVYALLKGFMREFFLL